MWVAAQQPKLGRMAQQPKLGRMQIFVKSPPLLTNYEMQSDDTLADLKQRIYETHGILVCTQRLFYQGRPLQDTSTLRECKITDGLQLELIIRLPDWKHTCTSCV